jgi:hypothetical protein
MSSRFYFSLVAFAGAGALFSLGIMFGLGVLTAPPKVEANTPSRYVQATKATTKAAKPVTDDDALTPIYPASPGPDKKSAEAKPDTKTAERQRSAAADEPAKAAVETAKANDSKEAVKPPPKEVANAAPASAQPIALTQAASKPDASPVPAANGGPEGGHCDVQACAAAYKSFRESDCTYQPYSGPRELCVKPPTPAQQEAAKPPQATKPPQRKARAVAADRRVDPDLDAAVEEVQRLTRGQRQPGFDSLPPPYVEDGRTIVIERQ